MSLGARIRQVRGKVARDEFSKPLGVHPQTLYLYEKGKRTPDLELIQKICTSHGISIEWLTSGEGEMFIARLSHVEITQQQLETPAETTACARCAEIKAELEEERRERRELARENRMLWRDNGELREENATMRERLREPAGIRTVGAETA